MHKSGFINIIGNPNVGKSTLMNALVGERMSIISNKPQTTRHRIIGIVSDADFQMVFSDTPGYIKDPSYALQESMNKFVKGTFVDADALVIVVDATENYEDEHPLFRKLEKVEVPKFLVINKIDLTDEATLLQLITNWQKVADFDEIIPISALEKEGTEHLFNSLLHCLPEGPEYYPKDQFTDRPERFFISEIIREKMLMNYHQEIPYSCEVVVDAFKEDETKNLVRIYATIYMSRNSQKNIVIGKKGAAIKKLGIDSRQDIEKFLDKKVYLELFVKVKENWRNDDKFLKSFGYQE